MTTDIIQENKDTNTKVAKSAFKVTAGNVLNLFTGFASQILVAALFGAGIEMDAYLTAIVVPSYLQAVLLGGLSFVFIPAFVRASIEDEEQNAWNLVGTFFWLILGILALIAIVGSLLPGEILGLSAPGLSSAKSSLAKNMLRIMMFSVPFSGLATLTGGIQNARNRFFWPAFAPALGSAGNLIVLILFYQRIGPLALAWGFLFSSIIYASVTILPVVRHGWSSLVSLRDPRVLEMFRLIMPFIFFGLITRSRELFERFFASNLPDGDVSYLGYARKIAKIFATLLGSGIVVAIFPTMAAAYVEGGKEGLAKKTEFGIKLTLATSLPVIAIVSALAVPLVTVLYERGAFTHAVTISVSSILPFFVIREVSLAMLGNVLVRAFYVTKDTITAPLVSTVTSSIYIAMAYFLVKSGGYVGLALATPLAAVIGTITLSVLLVRKLKLLPVRQLLKDTVLYVGSSLASFLVASFINSSLEKFPALIRLFTAGAAGISTYLIVLWRSDPEMLTTILEMSGVNRMIRLLKFGYLRIARGAE